MSSHPVLALGLALTTALGLGCNRPRGEPTPKGGAAGSAEAPAPAARIAPGDHHFTLGARGYVAHVPASAMARPALLVALHGGGGNAEGAQRTYRLDAVADREGFIVLYPEGTGKKVLGRTFATWNVGACCADPDGPDDVAFVERVLDDFAQRTAYDPARVYATGLSNGSQMAQLLGCKSERFAAIAATGALVDGACEPADRAVPTLYAAGKLDPCAKFEGGTCYGCFARALKKAGLPVRTIPSASCNSIADGMAAIARRNGCSDKRSERWRAGQARCEAFEGCRVPLELCVDDELGHHWPAGAEPAMCAKRPNGRLCRAYLDSVGPASDTIDFAERSWSFLKRFSR